LAQLNAPVRRLSCLGVVAGSRGDRLPQVHTPTLLIVGGDDEPVIELNQAAMRNLRATVELAVVHARRRISSKKRERWNRSQRLALDWFTRYINPGLERRHG
jgi:hypothetical protein